MSPYKPTSDKLFFKKNDPDDLRLGNLVKSTLPEATLASNSFCLLGYPDDDGIKLNGGRPGAAAGPVSIRQYLYKMTPPNPAAPEFYDGGDLSTESDLPTRHQQAQDAVLSLQKKRIRTITFGGGHDYGYADASGFLKANLNSNSRPLVINFDAHLDVRPDNNGFNSGTPFFRLLNEFTGKFDFAEVGIQPQCNASAHRKWALGKGAQIFSLSEILKDGSLVSVLQKPPFLQLTKSTPVFISFDIDCLTSTEAPGCSQSWVTGLKTQDFLQLLAKLCEMSDVRGLGIYEVSPPLDINDQTSKTAALIAYHYLFQGAL